uniref:Uncharacterized protein n=2 Tax=Plesiomonas shigelloides TaxID=703 RepID=Q9RLE5_PLESH|nr:hypothetical protein [Plesiomonas shigelloides]
MSRLIGKDFDLFLGFFLNYSLKDLASNGDFKKKLREAHKKYYPLLTLSAELDLMFRGDVGEDCADRVKETCSDIGSSIFLLAHGMYKQSNMSLRSSIENFLKSIGCNHCPDILTDKSVFSVFEKAGQLELFLDPVFKCKFDELQSIYSSLCLYTHTASAEHMAKISAMGSIPKHDKAKSAILVNDLTRLVRIYLFIYTKLFRCEFFKFNHDNRDVILSALTKSQRRSLMEPS